MQTTKKLGSIQGTFQSGGHGKWKDTQGLKANGFSSVLHDFSKASDTPFSKMPLPVGFFPSPCLSLHFWLPLLYLLPQAHLSGCPVTVCSTNLSSGPQSKFPVSKGPTDPFTSTCWKLNSLSSPHQSASFPGFLLSFQWHHHALKIDISGHF